MSRYCFFAKLANGLGVKQRPPIPLSKSLGAPGPQTSHSTSSRISTLDQKTSILSRLTSAVFEFPDELILSILSYVSPDPHRYARFHVQYIMDTRDDYRRRVVFLVPLSMTCRAMRLRLLPWIWGHVEVLPGGWTGMEGPMQRHKVIVGALRADPYLCMNVKYVYPLFVSGSGFIYVL